MALRTLAVSDLHLGARDGGDRLRDPAVLARLLGALDGVERLVLLGDALELRQGPLRAALAAAAPVLAALGNAMAGGEIVLVPGNHDHHLLSPWRERANGEPLALACEVDWRPGEPLSVLAGLLGPAHLRVSYPGFWLRREVYAIHGHYLDRHTTVPLAERLGAGVMARLVAEESEGPASPEDYERVLAPLYAWIHTVAQGAGEDGGAALGGRGVSASVRRSLVDPGGGLRVRRRALSAAFRGLTWGLGRAGLGELHSDLSWPALRRAGLRAIGEVVERLAVGAEHVVFGHTHRAGPLSGDDPQEWRTAGGVRLVNAGCWVVESSLGGDAPDSPYRPGFAVLLEEQGSPRLLNLLDPRPAPG